MTDIILKQGTGVPLDSDLEVAEVAIDNSTGDMYTKLANGSVKQLNPEGGTGAGMVISETEPADKVEGMQWLNPTNGLVLFWDDEKWLQMPGGVDGADGADGKGWTAGAYDDSTGVVTFDSDDGLGFSTGDLRGADGADGGTALVSDTEPSNPSSGTLWYDSANEALFVWDGNEWASVGASEPPTVPLDATGGDVTKVSGYKIHTFTSSGKLNVTGEGEVEFLVIGGGGGAGGYGGGGAGGYRNSTGTEASGGNSATESTLYLTAREYDIIVGAGGAKAAGATSLGTNGGNSTFSTITSIGGGGGGGRGNSGSSDGGSGGGSADERRGSYPGVGTAGQGMNGGHGWDDNLSYTSGGGGGGAGESGESVTSRKGGKGGDGISSAITGTGVARAGGGGGGVDGNNFGAAGIGGGGGLGTGQDGKDNTGGGGGRDAGGFGKGGSGVVIIRYRDPLA